MSLILTVQRLQTLSEAHSVNRTSQLYREDNTIPELSM